MSQIIIVDVKINYFRYLKNRLVVKTGSAKTKTKTANGSMKQNAHSSRKNYFYQKTSKTLIDVKFTTEYCI